MDFFTNLFDSSSFMPHGHCYFWEPAVLWTNLIGDALTALSYFMIPFLLIYFNKKRKDPDIKWVLWLFGAFILFCGTTHIIAIFTIWIPSYRIEGLVKLMTGGVSMVTAVYLIRNLPKALAIPSQSDLKEANEELTQFSYTVAHDLRSPLRHIAQYNYLLKESANSKLSSKELEHISQIDTIVKDMGGMIDELLEYTKSEKLQLEFQTIQTNELIDDIINDMEGDTTDRKVQWQIGDLPNIQADPTLIRVAFRNLLDNALKYTLNEEMAKISLNAHQTKDNVQLVLSDNGVGFDMSFQNKLFKPFERLHSHEEFGGYGIGLANVHRIILKHGGKIEAKSTPGQGASFFINLPLYEKRKY